jgi:peptide-methionine (R)-S-oxide reductase
VSEQTPTTGAAPTDDTLTWSDVLRLARDGNPPPPRRDDRTPQEWRSVLSREQFRVTRKAGTERAFSSDMCSLSEPGRYQCLCCGTELFDSSTTFDSGTGWPSFTRTVRSDVVAHHLDSRLFGQRVETVCNVCDAHLGHVFPDGPAPSGLRYCINAVAIRKVA